MYQLLLLPFLLPLLGQLPTVEEPPLPPPPPKPPQSLPVAKPTAPVVFDSSLQELEREGAITIKESQQLQRGDYDPPRVNIKNIATLCRSGVLSKKECAKLKGIAFTGKQRLNSGGLPLAPLTVPVSALLVGGDGSFSLSQVLRVTPRPAPLLGNGNRSLLFPLIGDAVTSSGFGWRLHPILGSMILHAGKDLAAPSGTPVVAALDGSVVSSGLAGGYGLAVEIEHRDPKRRTLYGHLSELFVQAGDRVKQGEVIGRVGSTGLSTGPHLHFELRRPDEGGWVAVDPGSLSPSGITASNGSNNLIGSLFEELLKGLERRS
jgi:murein DD-endopeptidase MepM/ murein hydrolase activator NlpD